MTAKIKIEFGFTNEEIESDANRQLEDAFIDDWHSGRYLGYYIFGDENKTQQQLQRQFKEEAEDLFREQCSEEWVTGIGYVHPRDMSLKLRLRGLFNKLKTLRIYKVWESDNEELPF